MTRRRTARLPLRTETHDTQARRWAGRLLVATVAWNAIEAVIAVGAGLAAGSIALIAFGLDSLIEVFAAGVVLWQLRGPVPAEREQRALRLIAISFFILAAYVTIEAVRDLLGGGTAETSTVGITLAAVSVVVMPALAVAKRSIGRRLGSSTLIAESAETFLCAALSLVLLVGLLLDAVGQSWADPFAALVIAALAVREGREALRGESCCAGTSPGADTVDVVRGRP